MARQVIEWVSSGATHRGNVRPVNQDAFLDRPDLGLWAVADGMGGHAAGEQASALVVERLARLPAPRFLGRAARQAMCLIGGANRRLLDMAGDDDAEIIGTTVAVLLALGDFCALLWVGDSRVYRLRDGQLLQLTCDHTEVQQWVAAGRLSADEAEGHPYAGVLSRAVGAEAELQIDCLLEHLQPADRYLLCSDGLTKELDAQRIAELLAAGDPDQAAERLLKDACAAGGRDNVSSVVVDFRSAGA